MLKHLVSPKHLFGESAIRSVSPSGTVSLHKCPYCESSRGANYYLKNDSFYCFSCGKSINNKASFELSKVYQGEIRIEYFDLEEITQEEIEREVNAFPVAYGNHYLESRNVLPETIERFNIRQAPNGIVFPFYHFEQITGYQIRVYNRTRGKYIQRGEFKSPYNFFSITNTDELYVVEGVFGVYNFYQHGIENVIAITGTGKVKKFLDYVMPFKSVKAVFDDDEAGHKAAQVLLDTLPLSVVRYAEADETPCPQCLFED